MLMECQTAYTKGMVATDFWESVKKCFGREGVKQKGFYANNKFALWIDLRTQPDKSIHGGGLLLNNTRDGDSGVDPGFYISDLHERN